MNYKKSMFNYIHKTNDGKLLLFNSFTGFNSLVEVSKNKAEQIEEMLHSDIIQESDDENFIKLKNLGYFVPADINEKLRREMKYMDTINESVLRLIILPTEQCNFRCKYCYETFEKGKMSFQTQKDLVEFVRKNIHKYSSMEVRWFGGEPLEALDVIENLSSEFIKICNAAQRKYTSGITTNAYDLSLENFKTLYRYHVYNYQITIDGIKETHDMQRVLKNGEGTFDKIINNLLDIKNNIKSGIPRFTIRTNFTKEIVNFLDEYLQFYYNHFGNDSRFTFSIQKAADWGGEIVKDFKDQLLNEDFYSLLLNSMVKNKIKLDIASHGAFMNAPTCVCYANKRNSFVIGSDGIIYKCTADFIFPKNKIGKLVNGNLEIDEDLHSEWVCKKYRKFPLCENCYFSGCCLSCSCPSSFIKGEKDTLCLFEKSFLSKFLELFNEEYFYKM